MAEDKSGAIRQEKYPNLRRGGPGRPKGSRDKVEEVSLTALAASAGEHFAAELEKVRLADPKAYVQIVMSALPKESRHDVTNRQAENLSTEHAKGVAEDFIESLRCNPGDRPAESGGVHQGDEARLQAGEAASQDSGGATAG